MCRKTAITYLMSEDGPPFLSRATGPINHYVGLSVGRSIDCSVHLCLFCVLSYLKVENFRYECFMDINVLPKSLLPLPNCPGGAAVYR